MSKIYNRLAAAALFVVTNAAVALAQSAMTAEIPFNFTTPAGSMRPGTYQVSQLPTSSSTVMYSLKNVESNKSVLLLAPAAVSRKASEQHTASLSFDCAGEVCALKAVYPAYARTGSSISGRILARRTDGSLAEVRIPAR
ncbi:MAG TPA: hypothetical protein VES20_16350 [Bryobacteraceae bacterium]|nr:hypothetical protein [Bryobacteraceae bacterium]